MFKVSWKDFSHYLQSTADVENHLNELECQFRQDEATLVTVEIAETGDSLAIGLGRDLSVLNYIRGDKSPPYMISKRELESDNVMEFRFGEELSEYSVRNCIPITNAREVVRHFCETGLLSQTIEWEVV